MDRANGPLTPSLKWNNTRAARRAGSPSEGAREIIVGAPVPGAALASLRLPRATPINREHARSGVISRPAGALVLARFARMEGLKPSFVTLLSPTWGRAAATPGWAISGLRRLRSSLSNITIPIHHLDVLSAEIFTSKRFFSYFHIHYGHRGEPGRCPQGQAREHPIGVARAWIIIVSHWASCRFYEDCLSSCLGPAVGRRCHQQNAAAGSRATNDWAVIEDEGNSRAWQRATLEAGSGGDLFPRTHHDVQMVRVTLATHLATQRDKLRSLDYARHGQAPRAWLN